MSSNSLARAQLVEAQDLASETSPALLREILGHYEVEISESAIQAFTLSTPELADYRPSADSQPWGSAKEVIDVFLAGIPLRICPDKTSRDCSGTSVSHATARPDLQFTDIFDFEPDSIWLTHVQSYLPLFTFVFIALRNLERSEQALAELTARARALDQDQDQPSCARGEQETVGEHVTATCLLAAMTMPGSKLTGIVKARRAAWDMRDWYSEIRQVMSMADAVALRSAIVGNAALARERTRFLAGLGEEPRLDVIGRTEIERVARDVQETTEIHVRLVRALLAEATAITRRADQAIDGVDLSALLIRVTTAEDLVRASAASLTQGEYRRALAYLSDVWLPLLPAGYPGLKFHQDMLAQVRPLAVLVLTQQMAAARWTSASVASYSRHRRELAELLYAEVVAFGRAHRDLIQRLGTTSRGNELRTC
ncbi:MAG TPA: hypothetical protein VN969_07090 [Streptosporangiaceae bacterium]|nr:hypothetical protein [Streptosporangiaceae bacterium]